MHVQGEIVVSVTPEETRQRAEAQRAINHENRVKRSFAWVTVISAIVAALTGLFSLWISKANFETDQRPYVWMSEKVNDGAGTLQFNADFPEKMLPDGRMGSHIELSFPYSNYGKSPAIMLKASSDLKIGPKAAYKLHDGGWSPMESILPPGKIDSFTGSTDTPVRKDALQTHMAVAGSVAQLVRLLYQDESGNYYETEICFQNPGPEKKTWDYCPSELHLTGLRDCSKDRCEPGYKR